MYISFVFQNNKALNPFIFPLKISDDEDDTHPNIDTASLFRWRHQARIEKMEKAEKDKKQFEEELMK